MTFQELKQYANRFKAVDVKFDHKKGQTLVNDMPFKNLIDAHKYIHERFEKTQQTKVAEMLERDRYVDNMNIALFGGK